MFNIFGKNIASQISLLRMKLNFLEMINWFKEKYEVYISAKLVCQKLMRIVPKGLDLEKHSNSD